MLNVLIERLKNNNISNNLNFGDYFLDLSPNGLFMFRKNRFVIFFSNDGKVYKISTRFLNHDWYMYCRFYEKVLRYNNCRIEIPIYREILSIDNILIEYTEVQRPGFEFGKVFMDDVANEIVDNNYFLEYIDQATIVIKYLEELSLEYNTNVPADLFLPFNRNRDKFGYFWTDFKIWNVSITEFKKRKIFSLYHLLISLEDINLDKNFIMKSAIKQWNVNYA